mmetsp:Transcript_108275/g.170734  ORF Transcript_108275/g.170734 Transcript_108275/m.170734 type:complete len:288 (-) Transcript_108275:977-1840(-)
MQRSTYSERKPSCVVAFSNISEATTESCSGVENGNSKIWLLNDSNFALVNLFRRDRAIRATFSDDCPPSVLLTDSLRIRCCSDQDVGDGARVEPFRRRHTSSRGLISTPFEDSFLASVPRDLPFDDAGDFTELSMLIDLVSSSSEGAAVEGVNVSASSPREQEGDGNGCSPFAKSSKFNSDLVSTSLRAWRILPASVTTAGAFRTNSFGTSDSVSTNSSPSFPDVEATDNAFDARDSLPVRETSSASLSPATNGSTDSSLSSVPVSSECVGGEEFRLRWLFKRGRGT